MTPAELLETGSVTVPWPTAIDGKFIATSRIEPTFCLTKCQNKECLQGRGTLLGSICHAGFTYYQSKINDSTVVIYGVVGSGGRETLLPAIRAKFKDDLKGRGATAADVQQWSNGLKKLLEVIQNDINRIVSDTLHPLHDTPKMAESIVNIAESMIQNRPGANMAEKFAAASGAEKLLLKSAEFLVDTFDMLTILLNPASATFGDLHTIEPYKLIDKLSRVLATSADGYYSKDISLKGASHRKFRVYESFRVIPLVILNNAIKYSFSNSIEIEVRDHPLDTWIHVRSEGPLIDSDEIEKIFLKGVRGKYADSIDKEGMGIGLYVAKLAADANGLKLNVKSVAKGTQRNDIPVAENTFSFNVRDIKNVS